MTEPPLLAATPPDPRLRHVRALLHAGALRRSILGADLFPDPAWDILLNLLAAELEHRALSVSDLRAVTALSDSTARRWIDALEARQLVSRNEPSEEGNGVSLSGQGRALLEQWLAQCFAALPD